MPERKPKTLALPCQEFYLVVVLRLCRSSSAAGQAHYPMTGEFVYALRREKENTSPPFLHTTATRESILRWNLGRSTHVLV